MAPPGAMALFVTLVLVVMVVIVLHGCLSVMIDNNKRTIGRTPSSSSETFLARPDHPNIKNNPPLLNMTVCRGKCEEDCKTYLTPIGVCFASGALFPNDPSWSDSWDVYDKILQSGATLHRTIYPTKNNTCGGEQGHSDDSFDIPLDVCVGPFGRPRPWGSFHVVEESSSSSIATMEQRQAEKGDAKISKRTNS